MAKLRPPIGTKFIYDPHCSLYEACKVYEIIKYTHNGVMVRFADKDFDETWDRLPEDYWFSEDILVTPLIEALL